MLPVDGVDGLTKGHFAPGARWDLGEPDDPERGTISCSRFEPGEAVGPRSYEDWHWLLVWNGRARLGDHELDRHDVLVAEPGVKVPEIVAGTDGVELFELARTVAGERGREE
jgi:hypothetical protein